MLPIGVKVAIYALCLLGIGAIAVHEFRSGPRRNCSLCRRAFRHRRNTICDICRGRWR